MSGTRREVKGAGSETGASPARAAIGESRERGPQAGAHGDRMRVPAGLWRRFMGMCYEAVILFGVLVFFGYAFSALAQFRGEAGAARWAFQAFLTLVLSVYFTWFWSEDRRTLPMKTLELVLRDRDGRPLGVGRALLRFTVAGMLYLGAGALAWTVSGWFLLLLPAPLAVAIFDRRHRALYDLIVGTELLHQRVSGDRAA